MGVVYKAHDTKLDRFVALKFLPSNITQDSLIRARFISEAKAASALDHQNICNIHEINETEDHQLYICMAYYQGESLRKKIDSGRLTFEESLNIFYQIVQGLKAAHDEKIIHRDLKPGNIIITDKGEVKIIDFGLAKLAGEKLTETISTKGTIAYMAPEVIRNQPDNLSADVWSLGVILYEMLTGHLPFQGEYPEPMMYSIVNEEPKSLSQYLSKVPEKLQGILDKLLQKDPINRYQNISDLLVDLNAFIKIDESLLIKKRSSIKRAFIRKRLIPFLVIIIFIGLLYLFVDKQYLSPNQIKEDLILVLPMKSLTNNAEEEWFVEGMTDILITDLAQMSGFRVISRSTAMKYQDRIIVPTELASELSIKYVIETSYAKSSDQLKILTSLIDAPEDEIIWANNYDRDYKDVLFLFGEISQDIVRSIKTELTVEEREQFTDVKTVNIEAYEYCLKGNYLVNQVNTGNYSTLNSAAEYFNKAIELDSSYALAYVGLSHCIGMLTFYGEIPYDEGVSEGIGLVKKALEIDENIADAHHGDGAYKLWQLWDWEGSGKAHERGISLNPNLTGLAKAEYLWYLNAMGRFEEAIEEGIRLLELDPLSPVARSEVAWVYFYARKYSEAIELCKRTLELEPDNFNAYYSLAMNYDQLKKHDEAHKSRLSAMKLTGIDPKKIAEYDSLYSVLGFKAYPTWQLKEQKTIFEKDPALVAEIYTQLGEKEKAFEWLEIAYEKHVGAMATINTKPTWDPLRGEPQFQEILKRMNFPD
jgi:serine/threonine protein kinase